MNNSLNIFQKLNICRNALQAAGLKKTGKNDYKGFVYFELSDFLPTVNKLNQENGLFMQFSISDCAAGLEILNVENPAEKISFNMPIFLPEGADMQKIGSYITYSRRYLLLMAYEICENDLIDADPGEEAPKAKSPAKQQAKAPAKAPVNAPAKAPAENSAKNEAPELTELRQAWQEARAAGLSNAEIEKMIGKSPKDMNPEECHLAAINLRMSLFECS